MGAKNRAAFNCTTFRVVVVAVLQTWLCVAMCAQESSHQADEKGSTEVADRVISAYSNASESFFDGLPDSVKVSLIDRIRSELPGGASQEERALTLLEAGNAFRQHGFRERAFEVFRVVGNDGNSPPEVRAKALMAAGDVRMVLDGDYSLSRGYYGKAVEVIDAMGAADREWKHGYVQLQALMRQADSIYCTDMNSDSLPLIYRRILEFEPEFGTTGATDFVAIGLDAARVMNLRNDPEAARYQDLVMKYLDKSDRPANRLISINLEILKGRYRDWSDPARINRLLKLWNDEKLGSDSAIMKVGNEILWAKFLERTQHPEEFDKFAEELVKRGDKFLEEPDLAPESLDALSIYISQAIAIRAFFQNERGFRESQEVPRSRYETLRSGKQVIGRFPTGATREQLQTMSDCMWKAVRDVLQIKTDERGMLPATKAKLKSNK